MKAFFQNVEDLARFCAELTRNGIDYEVSETNAAGRYQVQIFQPEEKRMPAEFRDEALGQGRR